MSTDNENAKNEQYIFIHRDQFISKVITYKTNIIERIKAHDTEKQYPEIQNFSAQSITDAKFERFVKIAKRAEYTIFKVIEL